MPGFQKRKLDKSMKTKMIIRRVKQAGVFAGLATLAACAQPVARIAPEVTSSARYAGWHCAQLHSEQAQVGVALAAATKTQKRAVTEDTFSVLLIGLPISGGGVPKEIASLKGRQIALEDTRLRRGCR